MGYCTVCALALASHSKTMFTDPGSVPPSAVPLPTSQCLTHHMCSHCQTFKPTIAHHCRICNRCISRMDHHCPWMNNCVGAGNLSECILCLFCLFVLYRALGCAGGLHICCMSCHVRGGGSQTMRCKSSQLVHLHIYVCMHMHVHISNISTEHFILFLIYTWLGAASALIIFAGNYFLCSSEVCIFSVVLIQLVRAMTILCIGAVLFTSSMLMNIQYGIMTGIGTIDRLKKKSDNTLFLSDEEEVPLVDIFGIGPYWTWCLPMDPVYQDHDRIMGFSTPQRLLREQMDQTMSLTSSKEYSEV